jgi:hypothetical protein
MVFRDQVPQAQKREDKLTVLYKLIFRYLESRLFGVVTYGSGVCINVVIWISDKKWNQTSINELRAYDKYILLNASI